MIHDMSNTWTVFGRLTRDVEIKSLPSGTKVGTFSVVHNSKYKKGNDWVEKVLFMEVKVWGDRAETVAKYFQKGSRILMECSLEQETWDKDGEKRSRIVAVMNDFKFVDAAKQENGSPEPKANPAPAAKKSPAGKKPTAAPVEETPPPAAEEDIPF